MRKIFCIISVLLLVYSATVCADEFDGIMTDDLKGEITDSFEIVQSDFLYGTNALELIQKMNSGDFSIGVKGIGNYVKEKFSDEMRNNFGFFIKITVLILLVSLIENICCDDKRKKAVSLLCASVVIITMIGLFSDLSVYVTETVDRLSLFINSLIPILLTLTATSGHTATAGMLNPIMLGVSSVITLVVKSVIIPLLFIGLALKLTDSVSGKNYLSAFGKQVYGLIKWITGFTLTIYIGIITVIGTAAPNVDEVTLKTAKYAVGTFVPYVGNMLTDSVELVLNCSSVVKNSVGVAGLIGVLSVVAVPCIKISVKVILFNILSTLVSPVAGKPVSNALDSVSSCLNIMLGLLFVVSVMYILSITVIIFIGGA